MTLRDRLDLDMPLDMARRDLRSSRYMRREEDARTAIKVRARERYYQNIEEQRMKRYLNALRKGLVRCPKESTLARHGILPTEDGDWTTLDLPLPPRSVSP